MTQSKHSLRIGPMTRSQMEFALGLRSGLFNTRSPAFQVQRQLPTQKKYLRLQRLARPKQEPAPQDQIPGQSEDYGFKGQIEFYGGQASGVC